MDRFRAGAEEGGPLKYGPEAYLRFMMYSGATRQEAVSMLGGKGFGDESPNLPLKDALSLEPQRYSYLEFSFLMDRFFDAKLSPDWAGGVDLAETRDAAIREPSLSRIRVREDVVEDVIVIGLTGERKKGKSLIASHLVETGFTVMHPFNPGKAFLRGYFVSRGATEDEAYRMTNGDLKDVESPHLPIRKETGRRSTSRWLMEELGKWMGVDMGPEWTIGTEIDYHMRSAEMGVASRWVMESIVYEAPVVQSRKGVRLIGVWSDIPAPGTEMMPEQMTDAFMKTIRPDFWFYNAMDGKDNLISSWDSCMAEHGIFYGQDAEAEPEGIEP